jgi:hypothetical protein
MIIVPMLRLCALKDRDFRHTSGARSNRSAGDEARHIKEHCRGAAPVIRDESASACRYRGRSATTPEFAPLSLWMSSAIRLLPVLSFSRLIWV